MIQINSEECPKTLEKTEGKKKGGGEGKTTLSQKGVNPSFLSKSLWLPFQLIHLTVVLRPKDALMGDSLFLWFLSRLKGWPSVAALLRYQKHQMLHRACSLLT